MSSTGAEAALAGPRQSEQPLQLIIDTIPTQVWSTRPDGSAEFLNQRWLDYTGLSADQARDWVGPWLSIPTIETASSSTGN